MTLRKTPLVPGEYYHIYNRGNSKQKIFYSPENYERFMSLLYLANGTTPWEVRELDRGQMFDFHRGKQHVAIGAYCLMPNHFHILLTPLTDTGVGDFMRKLCTGYSMYFNAKNNRTGSLFEGAYKSEHADDDRYLKYLFAYIHLNPVKLFQSDWRETGLRDVVATRAFLDSYMYSSYIETKMNRLESVILNRENYPNYFTTQCDLNKEMLDWLTYLSPQKKFKR